MTGGSRGIGRACVERLARDGYSVCFFCRKDVENADALTQSLRSAGMDVEWAVCDVASASDVRDQVGRILRYRHRIDVLINNAGISRAGLLTDITSTEWDEVFAVNVRGAFNMCHEVLPGMISRQSGSVIIISSMWGQVGAACEVCYSASKAALIGMTKALAKETAPSGVRVNCIAPGVIDTQMNARLSPDDMDDLAAQTPLGRIGSPEDIADAAAFLAGDQSAFLTGQIIGVNGGFVI